MVRAKRATFLAAMIGLLAAFFMATPAQARRPNIVIMLSDDQRWDAVGFVQRQQGGRGRFPFFQQSTPNIDRIAATGVWFNNAFVQD